MDTKTYAQVRDALRVAAIWIAPVTLIATLVARFLLPPVGQLILRGLNVGLIVFAFAALALRGALLA